MRQILTAAYFTFCLASTTLGQQAKLEGHVFDERNVPVSALRVIVPGGQAATTDSRGHFTIAFPPSVEAGQATRISIDKSGWVVYEPMLGTCVTQRAARNFEQLKVVIVPRGSPLALSPERLSRVISQWASERITLRGQVRELKAQIDEFAFLREYSKRYGFTLEQFENAATQWAKSQVFGNKEEQALKEYFLKNYDGAARLAHESALGADAELEQASRQKADASMRVIRRFTLEGNARYEQGKFSEALATYSEIDKRFETRKLVKEDFPIEWARTKILLGKVKGDLADRLEGAESRTFLSGSIDECLQALTVFSREKFPENWAGTQNNLAIAFQSQGERLEGPDGLQLIERAVDAFRGALAVYTRESQPQYWAMTEYNLGNVLMDKSERLEGPESMTLPAQSVEAYQAAMQVYTRADQPKDWAVAQISLGNALEAQGERLGGPGAVRTLAQAVAAYRAVLSVLTRETDAEDWATTQNNLGAALQAESERSEGFEGDHLLDQAADAHRAALQVYTRERFAPRWAGTQVNLATTLEMQAQRVTGRRVSELLSQAVDGYRAALQVYTREAFPEQWAITQVNLGNALNGEAKQLTGADAVRIFNQANEAFQLSLTVFTREAFPQSWAAVQNNLGITYLTQAKQLGNQEGERLLLQALDAFRQSLMVYKRDVLPEFWAKTQKGLEETYLQLGNWASALESSANVLSVSPDDHDAYRLNAGLTHNAFFRFDETFTTTAGWLTRHADDLTAQTIFAEAHFTTGRFAESIRRIDELLTNPQLSAGTKIALRAIEIASLLALGRKTDVPPKVTAMIGEVTRQTPTFNVEWRFEGTKHFIEQTDTLSIYRNWLENLFDAITSNDRNTMLKALQDLQTGLSQK